MKYILQAAWHSVLYLPLLFLLSCDSQKSVDKAEEEAFEVTWIALNKYPNFGALREAVYKASCHGDAYFIGLGLTEDRGSELPVLPPDCRDEIVCYKERNVMVLKRVSDYHHDSLRAHILNMELLKHHAISPTEAVVFLDLEDDTSIEEFKMLCDDLMNTYTSIWMEKSKALYGLPYNSLSKEQNEVLKEQYPIYIKFWPEY